MWKQKKRWVVAMALFATLISGGAHAIVHSDTSSVVTGQRDGGDHSLFSTTEQETGFNQNPWSMSEPGGERLLSDHEKGTIVPSRHDAGPVLHFNAGVAVINTSRSDILQQYRIRRQLMQHDDVQSVVDLLMSDVQGIESPSI